MAHTYALISAQTVNDQTTVIGTVDGIPFSIQVWHSAIVAFFVAGGAPAVKNFLAPLALAAAFPPAPAPDATVPTGTFVQ